jgi:prevent-host-death family protein
MEVNIHEAKTHLSRLLQRVAEGEEVTIARAGVPVAKLVPVEVKKNVRPLGFARGEIWVAAGHPVAPDRMALAVGRSGSTFADYGMRWDNSGKNGHYAPITWSN